MIKKGIVKNSASFLDCPARSAHMNPIKNVWKLLSRNVYANEKQYNDITNLKEAIENA